MRCRFYWERRRRLRREAATKFRSAIERVSSLRHRRCSNSDLSVLLLLLLPPLLLSLLFAFSLSLSFASLSLSRNSECALEFKKFQPNFSLLYLILFLCCTFQVFCVVRTVLSSWVSSFFSPICASLLNLKGHRELGKRKDPTSFSLFLEWRRFLLGLAGMGMRCLLGFTDPWLSCFCTGSSTF